MKKTLLISLILAIFMLISCGDSKTKEPSFAEQMATESEESEKEEEPDALLVEAGHILTDLMLLNEAPTANEQHAQK